MYGVLIVNEHRYLINQMVSDHVQDMDCKRILKQYPEDAIVDWDENPTREDLGY
jgi:hypothetical protein